MRPSACFVLLLIMKRNELFVTVSILTSIISFVFLNILFVFFSSGTQSSKLLIKSQHIQRINHFTFNECGKGWGGGGGGKRVLRYQRGNQNPYIEEQTPQRKNTKDKQRSTKHTHKTNYRVPLKTESELMCSKRVSSACSTSNTPRRANPATIPSNQNYVIRQNKNHFFLFLYKCLIEDWRIRLIIFVSFKWVCFHKIWRHNFVLKKNIAEHGRSLASTNTV
jgi:hypothetical protein